ncbi:hypothetical protein [Dongia rigui]|uniref:Membrane-anchored protein n=1 Tax=Dongia rigui TaxID=940149 RepID=A0ABU5DVF9_9PROT|nr:hypothetical protein [Dongia rigui]MDY0870920.1 hypothetical protein [Dongia rigui]
MSANADAVSQLDLSAATPAQGTAQIQGYIDAVEPDRIFGWAWNTSDPSERLSVEIRQGEQLIVRLEANQPRPDLVANGVGDGRYAFVANIPAIAEIDRAAPVTVLAITADGTTSVELKRQSAAPTPAAVSAVVLGEIRARDQRLQGQLKQLVSVAKERGGLDQNLNDRVTQSLEKLDTALPELDHRLEAMEVFQLRFDTLLQAIDKRLSTLEAKSQPRKPLLLWVWAAVTTAVSLALIGQHILRSF